MIREAAKAEAFLGVIAHPSNLGEEFAEDCPGLLGAAGREDEGFFSEGDHGVLELRRRARAGR